MLHCGISWPLHAGREAWGASRSRLPVPSYFVGGFGAATLSLLGNTFSSRLLGLLVALIRGCFWAWQLAKFSCACRPDFDLSIMRRPAHCFLPAYASTAFLDLGGEPYMGRWLGTQLSVNCLLYLVYYNARLYNGRSNIVMRATKHVALLGQSTR